MVGPALDVSNPLTTQLRLELRRATPGSVLSPLICQDLARCPVIGNPARERLQHQRAALVMRHTQTHKVP